MLDMSSKQSGGSPTENTDFSSMLKSLYLTIGPMLYYVHNCIGSASTHFFLNAVFRDDDGDDDEDRSFSQHVPIFQYCKFVVKVVSENSSKFVGLLGTILPPASLLFPLHT